LLSQTISAIVSVLYGFIGIVLFSHFGFVVKQKPQAPEISISI